MSLGYGIFDFLSLTQSAYQTVQNARKACGAHGDLGREISSLHVVLQRVEIEVSKAESILNQTQDNRREELDKLARHCEKTLNVLAQILEKYNALSEEKRRVTKLWKRVKFGSGEMQDLSKIRLELATHTQSLNLFLNLLSIGSQGKVEMYMDSHGEELREIKHFLHWVTALMQANSHEEKSILTTYAEDDKAIWKAFRRELTKDGCSSRVLGKHRKTIKIYVMELATRGVLDDPEEEPDQEDESEPVDKSESEDRQLESALQAESGAKSVHGQWRERSTEPEDASGPDDELESGNEAELESEPEWERESESNNLLLPGNEAELESEPEREKESESDNLPLPGIEAMKSPSCSPIHSNNHSGSGAPEFARPDRTLKHLANKSQQVDDVSSSGDDENQACETQPSPAQFPWRKKFIRPIASVSGSETTSKEADDPAPLVISRNTLPPVERSFPLRYDIPSSSGESQTSSETDDELNDSAIMEPLSSPFRSEKLPETVLQPFVEDVEDVKDVEDEDFLDGNHPNVMTENEFHNERDTVPIPPLPLHRGNTPTKNTKANLDNIEFSVRQCRASKTATPNQSLEYGETSIIDTGLYQFAEPELSGSEQGHSKKKLEIDLEVVKTRKPEERLLTQFIST